MGKLIIVGQQQMYRIPHTVSLERHFSSPTYLHSFHKIVFRMWQHIRFWVDPWVSSSPLSSRFHDSSISLIFKKAWFQTFTPPCLIGMYISEGILENPKYRNMRNFQPSSNNSNPLYPVPTRM